MWIAKFDGSIQCEDSPGETIESVLASLKTVIRDVKSSEKRKLSVPTQCGLPTGACFAFEIADKDAAEHAGELGSKGFFPWPGVAAAISGNSSRSFTVHLRDREWAPFPFRLQGNDGFWPWRLGTDWVPFPLLVPGGTDADVPFPLQALIGRPCRLYRTGDPITKDFVRNRLSIEVGEDGKIVNASWG